MNKDENLPYLFNEEADDAMPPMKQMGLPTSKITIAELLKPQAGSIGLVTLTFIGTEILQSREWKKIKIQFGIILKLNFPEENSTWLFS